MDCVSGTIGDRYHLQRLLGQGAQSKTYLAQDSVHDLAVVIKEAEPETCHFLHQEYYLLQHFHHPHLIDALDLFKQNESSYLVQSFAAGPDFVTWATAVNSLDSIGLAAAALFRTLQYLQACDLIHRDLKPGHIRVGPGLIGAVPELKVIDFGLAVSRADATLSAKVTGTLAYMAPEIVAGEPATFASDWYSVGAILFHALWGYPPPLHCSSFGESSSVPSFARNTLIGELVANLLQPEPKNRPSPQTCLETLSLIVHQPLELQTPELKGSYWPSPPLVGREDAISRLKQVMEQVAQGHSAAIQFTGVGKSAMANEACVLGKTFGFQVVIPTIPLNLFQHLCCAPLDPSQLEQSIHQLVGTLLAQTKDKPLLFNLDSWEANDPVATKLVSQLTWLMSQHELEGCLLLWSGELPADQGEIWEQIKLDCLNLDQIAKLIRGMLYINEPPLWLPQIPTLTGGDPRWVVELIWAQIEAGLPDTLILPQNRTDLAENRLATLSSIEKHLLAIVALSPRPMPYRILHTVIPESMTAISGLLRRQVLSFTSLGLYPSHYFLHCAAQRFLTPETQRDYHHRLATAWQQEVLPDALALGHHLIRSGRIAEGVKILFQLPTIPPEELEYVLSLLPADDEQIVKIQRCLAKLYCGSGNLERSLSIAANLEQQWHDEGLLLKAELLLSAGLPHQVLEALGQIERQTAAFNLFKARAYLLQGDYASALRESDKGLESPGLDTMLTIQLRHLAGLSLVYSGKPESALKLLDQATKFAEQIGHTETQARLANSRGITLQRLGRLNEAAAAYNEALCWVQKIGDIRLAASATMNLGTIAYHLLELTEAFSHFRQAYRLAQRGKIGTTATSALANEANLLLLFGAWGEARIKLEQAETMALKSGAQSQLGHIYLYQAEIYLHLNHLTQTEVMLRQARQTFSATDSEGQEAADWLHGEVLLRYGEYGQARQICDDLLRRMIWQNPNRWRVLLLSAKLALNALPMDLDLAIQALEQSVSLARLTPAAEKNWEPYALLANCYRQLGRPEDAAFYARQFQHAVEVLRQQIPLPYRLEFDQRPDLQHAIAEANQIWDPSLRSIPSCEELKQLLEINKALNRFMPVEALLHRVMELAVQLTGAARGFAILQEDDELHCLASSKQENKSIDENGESFSHSLARLVISSDQPLLAANATKDVRFQEYGSIQALQIKAVLCVPIRIQGQPRGALYVDHQFKTNLFSNRQVELLQAFADQAGIALESTRILQDAHEKQAALMSAKILLEQQKQNLEGEISRKTEELSVVSLRLRAQDEALVERYQQQKIIGRSKVMRELYLAIDRIAESDLPVFIYGESGTGKDLIARAIHYHGARKDDPFVPINCAAIPPHLIESELFGHVRGSFTSAHQDRPGLFEFAGKGSLFLDEIGDLPWEMQSTLLRVLQEGTFRRIGEASGERQSHCRILSAANRRLGDLVANKTFRQDLYYRLNVLTLELPPLRERREDIPLLIQHLLGTTGTISPRAMALLLDYDWPGNIRELETEIRRAQLFSEGAIDLQHLSPAIQPKRRVKKRTLVLEKAVNDYERELIESALLATDYNVSGAAKRLGMHRTTLHSKMRVLGIARKHKGN